jgi:hypothetical protein
MTRPKKPRQSGSTNSAKAVEPRPEVAAQTEQATGPGSFLVQLREERMEEERADTMYPLKAGGQIGGRHGRFVLLDLEGILEQSPHLFQALLAIVQDRREDAPPEALARLSDCGYLKADDGTVRADIRDVLLSAFQDTPEGPVLGVTTEYLSFFGINPIQFELHEVRFSFPIQIGHQVTP